MEIPVQNPNMQAGSISRSLLFRPSTAPYRRVLKLWKNNARAPLHAGAYGWRDQGKGQWNYSSYSATAMAALGVCRGLGWVQVKKESEDDKFISECDSLYSRSEFIKLKVTLKSSFGMQLCPCGTRGREARC